MRRGRREFSPSLIPTLAAGLVFCLLVALGVWQLQRAQLKQDLSSAYELRSGAPAIELTAGSAAGAHSTNDLRHRRVVASGWFETDKQFLLDNRTHNGRAGFHVLTPLRLNEDTSVIVNRGWVPLGRTRGDFPDLSMNGNRVSVRGRASVPPAETILLGAAGYENDSWPRIVQRIDLDAMERAADMALMPVVVLLDADQAQGFVRDWKAFAGIGPTRHKAYALQWFSLAGALVVIYLVVNTRAVPDRDGDA